MEIHCLFLLFKIPCSKYLEIGSARFGCMSESAFLRKIPAGRFCMNSQQPKWKKPRGYLHLSPNLSASAIPKLLKQRVENPDYVAQHAFMPLLHVVLRQRRFKAEKGSNRKAHSHKNKETGIVKSTAKDRPLHYAAHMDALIFGSYAEQLSKKYEAKLAANRLLNDAITAYRRIPIPENPLKNKNTIHFAKEVFEEIRKRCAAAGECTVMAFDIKSFFPSLNHSRLKAEWAKLLGSERLPKDHFNVFKAATQFSYIYLDELKTGPKGGWDEAALEKIRRENGYSSLFASYKDFREQLAQKKFQLHKYPFWNKKNDEPIGIPQGLPISTVLANVYLSAFDENMISALVVDRGAFYRRYSDDIVVISEGSDVGSVETLVKNGIEDCDLRISTEKTEVFQFRDHDTNSGKPTFMCSIRQEDGSYKSGKGFSYLGFTFNGRHVLIKTANVSKYYRKLIKSVKAKSRLAWIAHEKNPTVGPALYTRQLLRLIEDRKQQHSKVKVCFKRLRKTDLHGYQYHDKKSQCKKKEGKKPAKSKGSFLSYVKRASFIMDEPAIERQIRNRRRILGQAVKRHFVNKRLKNT